METLEVKLGERAYPIYIGSGLLDHGELLAPHLGTDVLVVSDVNVAPLYTARLDAQIGDRVRGTVVLPCGEPAKTLDSVSRIVDELTATRCGRDATVVALGGGVVGDIAGFAAAIYLRGIDVVQIPTTLLAQVDSSVGGKTGVNHARGKNLIGAFHQPRCVLADTGTLATLDPRELRAGVAEVIKHGLLADREFFAWLETHMPALLEREPAALARAVRRCCEIKAAVVAEDEREHGRRALLNLGHTFAHAIETETGYAWLHGEAVAAGLVMAARLSARLGQLNSAQVERVARLVSAAGLSAEPPSLTRAQWRQRMSHDKKVSAGRLRLVLLDDIGAARVDADVPDAALDAVLDRSAVQAGAS